MAKVIDIEAEIPITSVQLDAMVSLALSRPRTSFRLPLVCAPLRSSWVKGQARTVSVWALYVPMLRVHVGLPPMATVCPFRSFADETFGVRLPRRSKRRSATFGTQSLTSGRTGICVLRLWEADYANAHIAPLS